MTSLPIRKLKSRLNIGAVEIPNRVFLAPMSGITDLPFRQLARKLGAGAVVSEMVACEALIKGEEEMRLKAAMEAGGPNIVQLAGREAKWMALAAKLAADSGADIVDINMGCPAKRVTNGYSGSALMRDLDHAEKLISAVVEAVDIPVTLKMRLGWDHETVNAPELAVRAENNGVVLVTVHGRTRCQFYKGVADWRAVSSVKSAVGIPVVVNGDIGCTKSARPALEQSQADAIMVGRACVGAPWLPALLAGQITAAKAGLMARDAGIVLEHYENILSFYGTKLGVRQARKHLSAYMENIDPHGELKNFRKAALTQNTPADVMNSVASLFRESEGVSTDLTTVAS